MSYAGLERAFCPSCGIERAPEKHLPSCPKCGSGEAPSRGALLECPLCDQAQGSVVIGEVRERFVFQPDGMAVEDDVPRELRLWCNTDPEHDFGTLPIDPTYGLPNMAEDVKAAVARAEGRLRIVHDVTHADAAERVL